jgi:hypothetical protein
VLFELVGNDRLRNRPAARPNVEIRATSNEHGRYQYRITKNGAAPCRSGDRKAPEWCPIALVMRKPRSGTEAQEA